MNKGKIDYKPNLVKRQQMLTNKKIKIEPTVETNKIFLNEECDSWITIKLHDDDYTGITQDVFEELWKSIKLNFLVNFQSVPDIREYT